MNADLHLHGLYSGATSSDMVPTKIAEQASLKGLQVVGTADILNGRWLSLVKQQLQQIDDSIFRHPNGTFFVLQTEVEDAFRVHHIILFPSLSKVAEVKEKFSSYCKDLDGDGRPKIGLSGEEIAETCTEAGCLIGPAHCFTPWTSVLKEYNSIEECYKSVAGKVHFIELGLSADTAMADRISALHKYTFVSASDGHSPWPNKLGREFTRFAVTEVSFEELSAAIKREQGRKPTLNLKFNPKEGKYHKTRCIGCLTFYDARDAASYRWRCPVCHAQIKKGVADRVEELADSPISASPPHRPPCIHTIPLSEIIAIALATKQTFSQRVQDMWRLFVSRFGSEISVLADAKIDELGSVNARIAELIGLFREDKFDYVPGGGGQYGIPIPPGQKAEIKVWKGGRVQLVPIGIEGGAQKSLSEFFD